MMARDDGNPASLKNKKIHADKKYDDAKKESNLIFHDGQLLFQHGMSEQQRCGWHRPAKVRGCAVSRSLLTDAGLVWTVHEEYMQQL